MNFDALPECDLDDAINAHKTAAVIAAVNAIPLQHIEKCPKCRGTGRFVGYSGRVLGDCFACKGKGQRAYKTSSETRAANRQAAADRKVAQFDANLGAFQQAQPEVWAWIQANPTFEFAQSLGLAVAKYGHLTENQLAAAQRCIARSTARQEAAQARAANAPAIDTTQIEAAFSKASAVLKEPTLHVAGFVIAHAKATSANPGALYVKASGTYLGKIMSGKFHASRDCQPEDQAKLLEISVDPKGAAIAYGRLTGRCACCNQKLTKAESVARGIGPICAERFGW